MGEVTISTEPEGSDSMQAETLVQATEAKKDAETAISEAQEAQERAEAAAAIAGATAAAAAQSDSALQSQISDLQTQLTNTQEALANATAQIEAMNTPAEPEMGTEVEVPAEPVLEAADVTETPADSEKPKHHRGWFHRLLFDTHKIARSE